MEDIKKKSILVVKIILVLAMLAVSVYLVYNNFFNKEDFYYEVPEEKSLGDLYIKFDLDVLQNEIFENLQEYNKVSTTTLDEKKGRVNPFLKYSD